MNGNFNVTPIEKQSIDGDLGSINSLDLSIGEPVVNYDTTDGISINTDAKFIYGEDNKEKQFAASIEIPIAPADNTITIGADSENKKAIIKANLQPLYDTKLQNASVSFTIETTDWAELLDKSPYKYSATIDCSSQITTTGETVYELINDNVINFANYGFALNEVSFGGVGVVYDKPKFTFYAIEKPTAQVTLKVLITANTILLLSSSGETGGVATL